jgi:hypothetical protein
LEGGSLLPPFLFGDSSFPRKFVPKLASPYLADCKVCFAQRLRRKELRMNVVKAAFTVSSSTVPKSVSKTVP